MGKNDDFVMTIEDDQDIVVDEPMEEIEEDKPVVKKPMDKKEAKKMRKLANREKRQGLQATIKADVEKKKKAEKDSAFDDQFTFSMDGGSGAKPKDWDFTAARGMLKGKQGDADRTSIDDIIAKKRQENKDKKKKSKVVEVEQEEEEEAEDETSEFVGAASDDDEEEEEEKTAENDEDLALDGFGAGAERIEQIEEEDEEDSDSDTEEDLTDGEAEDIQQGSDEEVVEDEAEKQRKKEYFADEEEEDKKEHQSFASMNLSRPILKGLSNVGFVKPTDIQSRTIPISLMGKDICGGAVTGSGKTAAFIVPILERLLYRPRQTPSTRVLILCPTRELAAQVHSVAVKLANYTDITFALCVGGLSVKTQEQELKLKPDVVVATPGRLIDHVRNSSGFHLDACEILVMDEADRMLEDGFADELGEIIKACPRGRQTMLFSATMTDNVDQLVRMSLNNPVRLFVDPSNQAASRLIQEFVRIRQTRESDRAAVLLALCRKTFKEKVIVFFRSKAAAHQMKILFGLMGLSAAELHGNLTQEQRLEALERFRDNEVDYLLATDLAARGLDIKGIETVINYNMPTQFAQYLHRVGRTARAGRNGRSVTLVGESDRKMLKMAIKSSVGAQVKNRVVNHEVVQRYKQKVESLGPQIKEVLAEEKQERAIRNAEMQLKKSENMLHHGAEIYARPARTWFQTETEKRNSSEAIKNKSGAKDTKPTEPAKPQEKRGKYDGMSRQKRRRMQAMEDSDAEDDGRGQKFAARAAKKSSQPTRITKMRAPKAGGKKGKK
ncbi:P-loop containing nucleoside triphosphate hydrolase protein [Mucor mucedo]|uniref:P-loop containing nucleoside triphosphate hydrolase protein n=1 Tax=Mucor mucedo TaxID=29922 RepID=UPI00221F76F4|nr:P-loop containing nucleoside triphosphate hydrolase protein [Mucor mucedo]KAI7896126.1 P-loop containing nucleoside triphosphate hydrolase protein [Mucor mucedo]